MNAAIAVYDISCICIHALCIISEQMSVNFRKKKNASHARFVLRRAVCRECAPWDVIRAILCVYEIKTSTAERRSLARHFDGRGWCEGMRDKYEMTQTSRCRMTAITRIGFFNAGCLVASNLLLKDTFAKFESHKKLKNKIVFYKIYNIVIAINILL